MSNSGRDIFGRMGEHWESYPLDFRRALENELDEVELDNYLKGTVAPIFVFGPLMSPSVLKSVTGMDPNTDVESRMIHGSLLGYKLGIFEDTNIPFVLEWQSVHHCVNGMLVFGLTREQKECVYEFEASNSVRQEVVKVEVVTRDFSLRIIDAGAFVWKNKTPFTGMRVNTGWWDIHKFFQEPWYKILKNGYESG